MKIQPHPAEVEPKRCVMTAGKEKKKRKKSTTLRTVVRFTRLVPHSAAPSAAIPPDACIFRAHVKLLLSAETSRLARLRRVAARSRDAF